MADDFTAKFKVDISDLKSGISEATKQIKFANATFKAETAGMDKWSKDADGLSAKLRQLEKVLENQRSILNAYRQQLERQQQAYAENGARAEELKRKLQELASQGVSKADEEYKKYEAALKSVLKEQANNEKASDELKLAILEQEAAVKGTEKQIRHYESELDNLEDGLDDAGEESDELAVSTTKAGDAAEKSESKFGKLAKTLAAGLATAMVAVTTAAIAAGKKIWDLSGEVAALGDEIDKNSQKVGLSSEAYQKWDYAMKISGTEMASCTTGLKTLTNTFDDAINGSASAAEKFTRLGLSLEDIRDMSREDLFATVVNSLQNVSSETEKAALANDLFGKSGQDMLPLLNLTEKQLGDLMDEAEQYGMIMSDDAVASSAAFQDSLTKLRGTMTGARNAMVGVLLPGLTSVMNGFSGLVAGVEGSDETLKKGFADIIKNVKTLIPQAIKLIASLASAFLEAAPEIVKALAEGIVGALPGLVATIQKLAPALANVLLSMLPILVQTGVDIILALMQGASSMLPQVLAQISQMIPQIINILLAAIPQLLQSAVSLFMALVEALPIVVQNLLGALPLILDTILGSISEWLPLLLDGAVSLFMALVDALPIVVQNLLGALPLILDTILGSISEWLPLLLDSAVVLLMALVDAIPFIVQSLTDELPRLVEKIVSLLLENLPVLLRGAITLFMALVSAIPEIAVQLVKALPQIVSAFISGLSNPLKQLFTGLWDSVKNLAKGALDSIKNLWSTVSGWFNEKIIQPVKNFFAGMWDGLKNGAKQAWTGIKNVFGGVADWFKNIFSKAWQKVKDVFSTGGKIFEGIKEGIVEAFKSVVNAIIRGINTVISIPFNAINAVFRKLKGISILGLKPFDWLNEFNVPQIPQLARGGILKRGQVGLLEGNGAEAVVPLDQNKKWVRAVANDLLRALRLESGSISTTNMDATKTYNFTQIINAPKQPSRAELYRQTRNLLEYAKGGN